MAMDILDEIVRHKRLEVEHFKQEVPPAVLYAQVERLMAAGKRPPSMRQALLRSATGVIAEFKRRSPSKGWIKEEGRADVIPLQYQQAGAAALSILTDRHFFGGDDRFIRQAADAGVCIPVLYKNFIIDEYQLFQARLAGASAVLLIAADLSWGECAALLSRAHELDMEVLLEMHGSEEIDYADLGPDLYGINNRHLGSFVTDVEHSFSLAEMLPDGECWVSESGISQPDTVRQLREAGFRGFLIGECFMRTPQPGEALRQFILALSNNKSE